MKSGAVLLFGMAALQSPAFCADLRLAQEAFDGHRASREAIVTLACGVTLSRIPTLGSARGEYWWTHNASRARCLAAESTSDWLRKANLLRSCVRRTDSQGRVKTVCQIRDAEERPLGDCDPWLYGMFKFGTGEGSGIQTVDDLLDRGAEVRNAARDKQGGIDLVRVTLANAKLQLDLWFDPAANYLIRKADYAKAGSSFRSISEVVQFREVVPGIFFPERVSARFTAPGPEKAGYDVVFHAVKINRAIATSVFELDFPAGAVVADGTKGVFYTADASGRPVGKVQSIPVRTAPLSSNRTVVSEVRGDTKEEPPPAGRWIVPVSLTTFVLAAAGLLYSRLKGRKR